MDSIYKIFTNCPPATQATPPPPSYTSFWHHTYNFCFSHFHVLVLSPVGRVLLLVVFVVASGVLNVGAKYADTASLGGARWTPQQNHRSLQRFRIGIFTHHSDAFPFGIVGVVLQHFGFDVGEFARLLTASLLTCISNVEKYVVAMVLCYLCCCWSAVITFVIKKVTFFCVTFITRPIFYNYFQCCWLFHHLVDTKRWRHIVEHSVSNLLW